MSGRVVTRKAVTRKVVVGGEYLSDKVDSDLGENGDMGNCSEIVSSHDKVPVTSRSLPPDQTSDKKLPVEIQV